MAFGIKEYRLEYTIWAAYRAAQAGSSKAKGTELSAALKECGVIEYLDSYQGETVSEEEFKQKHIEWSEKIISYIKDQYDKNITYGIAAKLLGVFNKGYFILAGNENTPLAKVMHPPVDSYLLKGIDKQFATKLDNNYKWQKLDINSYYELLPKMRSTLKEGEAFWLLEKFWELG